MHLDGCVEVEAAYYGAPPGWIGRKVNVQWDSMFVRLLDPRTGELLREHLSGKRGGHRIRDADRPRRTPPSCFNCWPVRTRREPTSAPSATPSMLARVNSECVASRACSNWSRNMAARLADDACAAALELRVPEYRFVRRYLERRPQAPLSLRQVDPLIRELTQYRDLIQQRIHFEETKP